MLSFSYSKSFIYLERLQKVEWTEQNLQKLVEPCFLSFEAVYNLYLTSNGTYKKIGRLLSENLESRSCSFCRKKFADLNT